MKLKDFILLVMFYFPIMNFAALFWPLSFFTKNKRIRKFYCITFYLQVSLSFIIFGIIFYTWKFTENGTITDLMAPSCIGIIFLTINLIALFTFGLKKIILIFKNSIKR
jgi:hypothetical protein